MPKPKLSLIIKASGEEELFLPQKLIRSLRKAGASSNVAKSVLKQVEEQIVPGCTTHEIYKLAFNILKKYSNPCASKYKLKKAVMNLGPTGHVFEQYIGSIYRTLGFQTKLNVSIRGKCISHEVDVVATRGDQKILVECKHHSKPGIKADVKTALYIHARSLDLKVRKGYNNSEFYLITNTKFSDDAQKYSSCAQLHIKSWNFPKNGSLFDLIQRSKTYPITVLNTLTSTEKNQLIEKSITNCSELKEQLEPLAQSLRLSLNKHELLKKELHDLL